MKFKIDFYVQQNTSKGNGYWKFDILPTLTICRMDRSDEVKTYYAFIGWLLWDATLCVDMAKKGGHR